MILCMPFSCTLIWVGKGWVVDNIYVIRVAADREKVQSGYHSKGKAWTTQRRRASMYRLAKSGDLWMI